MVSPVPAPPGPMQRGLRLLFAPAVALMNRLKYPQKFLLISIIFLLPLGLVMYLLLSEIDDRIDFARKEMLGIQYLRPLRVLYEQVAQSRVLARAYTGGRVGLRPEVLRKQRLIDESLERLFAVDQQLGQLLNSTGRYGTLQESWRFLKVKVLSLEPQDSDDLHAGMLTDLHELSARVGDSSNLILDPDLDSYYVMDAVLLKLPQGEALAAQTQVFGQKSIVAGKTLSAEERAEFIRLAGLLRSNLDETTKGMDIAFGNNPAGTLKPHLERPLRDHAAATGEFLRLLESDLIKARTIKVTPEEFDRVAVQALTANFTFWDQSAIELDDLLQRRIAGFARQKYLVEVFSVVALVGVCYLLIAFYLAVMRTVRSLRESSDRMVGGSIDHAVSLETRDELGQVVTSFNNIATKLREEWTQAREESTRARAAEAALEMQKRAAEQKSEELAGALQQLKAAQDQLLVKEKLASLGTLTAGIAHEIKNPLNFVTNFAQLSTELVGELGEEITRVKDRLGEDDSAQLMDLLTTLQQNVTRISEHGHRADRIVRDMLAHSRQQSGERQLTDVNALLDQYVALAYHGMRAQDSSFNVTLETHYDKTLPRIPVHAQDLSRVFLNLVNNACYAVRARQKTEANGFTPTIAATTRNLGDRVEIRIRDNGSGIPATVRNRLFQPFFTTKPTGEGTGLGLSISYDIVVQGHQGSIQVESEEGQFAEFIIALPIP